MFKNNILLNLVVNVLFSLGNHLRNQVSQPEIQMNQNYKIIHKLLHDFNWVTFS